LNVNQSTDVVYDDYDYVLSQALNDDVALHKVDIDDICGMARTIVAISSIKMVTAEANQLAGRFQALVSNAQVRVVRTTLLVALFHHRYKDL